MSASEKMTAIADNIREINGGTTALGLDAMASELEEILDEITTQSNLIDEIQAALEDKASGSGSTAPDVFKLTTSLTGIDSTSYINYMSYVNGNYVLNKYPIYYVGRTATQTTILSNVVCGSLVAITGYQTGTVGLTLPTTASLVGSANDNTFNLKNPSITFKAPTSTNDATVTIVQN